MSIRTLDIKDHRLIKALVCIIEPQKETEEEDKEKED